MAAIRVYWLSFLLPSQAAWVVAWADGAMRSTLAQFDPAAHNGAPLLGLNGVVVKSHGSPDVHAMTRAILGAGREARQKVPEEISASMRVFKLEKQT